MCVTKRPGRRERFLTYVEAKSRRQELHAQTLHDNGIALGIAIVALVSYTDPLSLAVLEAAELVVGCVELSAFIASGHVGAAYEQLRRAVKAKNEARP